MRSRASRRFRAPAIMFAAIAVIAAMVAIAHAQSVELPKSASNGGMAALDAPPATAVSAGASISPAFDAQGRPATLMRITSTGSSIVGGVRAENLWSSTPMRLGRDYWMAFGFQQRPGESVTPSKSDDAMVVMQTHTPAMGDTTPDISLVLRGQDMTVKWMVAYNTKPSNAWKYVKGPYPDTEKAQYVHSEALPAAGAWTRYVVHYRPGYTTEHAPRFRVWRAAAGADFEQIVDTTQFNTYNSLSGPSYPRIGPYKWSSSVWNSTALSFLVTPMYFGEGADLLEAAKMTVRAFK